MDSTTDEPLMLRVRHGEVEALGTLYERHRAPLLNFFVRLTGNVPLSEDLVQDVFLRMLKYRHTFVEGNRFTTWMYHIGRNTLHDAWRKRGRESAGDDGGVNGRECLVCPGLPPDATMRQRQEVALLQEALAALSLESREVLVLSRFQNLKYEEIARILQCGAGAVKMRVHRALKELRDEFSRLAGKEVV